MGHDGQVTAQSLTLRPAAVRGLLAVLAATALVIVAALPALAHASLVRSSPESGSTLTAAPPEVALTFNEEINPQFATVTVKAGDSTASTGDPDVQGTTVYQPLDPEMTAGTYTVAYRVTSADGHPVSGSFDFTYAPGGGDEGADETGGTAAPAPTTSGSTSASTSAPTTSETSGTTGTSTSGTSDPESTTSSSTSTTSTEVTTSPSSTTTDSATTAADNDGGVPWWVWVLGLVVVLGLVGGTVLLLGRRGDEELDLESYGLPHEGDDTLR